MLSLFQPIFFIFYGLWYVNKPFRAWTYIYLQATIKALKNAIFWL